LIIVHHLNNSRSQRVLWLLEELELPYEIKRYERDPETMMAPPSLKKVHPLGKSPVISDGEKIIAESGAILEYLVDEYGQGRLKPKERSHEALRYRYFMHYAEGSAMPPLLLSLVFSRLLTVPLPFFVKPIVKEIVKKTHESFINPQIRLHLDFIESELGQRSWFCGEEMTTADIQMSFILEAAVARGGLNESYPKLQAFLKKIHSRAAYQRAVEKGGPFELLM